MKKVLALSVSPTEALNVLNGKQSALLRKRVPKGYVGLCYGVVSKGKPYIANHDNYILVSDIKYSTYEYLNGRIPFRFWYEGSIIIPFELYTRDMNREFNEMLIKQANMSKQEAYEYSNGKDLYAISITKLEVFDKPMELGEFYSIKPMVLHTPDCIDYKWYPEHDTWLKYAKTPSTYQYVWVKE
jgi:predicted transcriptional regulator